MTAKFEGYIERRYVNATGQYMRRGEVLIEVYSRAARDHAAGVPHGPACQETQA